MKQKQQISDEKEQVEWRNDKGLIWLWRGGWGDRQRPLCLTKMIWRRLSHLAPCVRKYENTAHRTLMLIIHHVLGCLATVSQENIPVVVLPFAHYPPPKTTPLPTIQSGKGSLVQREEEK